MPPRLLEVKETGTEGFGRAFKAPGPLASPPFQVIRADSIFKTFCTALCIKLFDDWFLQTTHPKSIMPKTTESSLPGVVSALKALATRLKNLRTKVSTINEQIDALRNAPVSLDDFLRYLRQWVDRRGEIYANGIKAQTLVNKSQGFGDGVENMNCKSWDDLEGYAALPANAASMFYKGGMIFNSRDSVPIDMVCFFMPDVVFEKLSGLVKKDCAARWGNEDAMPINDRIKAIKAFKAELARLKPEIAEVDAEISGVSGAINDAAA